MMQLEEGNISFDPLAVQTPQEPTIYAYPAIFLSPGLFILLMIKVKVDNW